MLASKRKRNDCEDLKNLIQIYQTTLLTMFLNMYMYQKSKSFNINLTY